MSQYPATITIDLHFFIIPDPKQHKRLTSTLVSDFIGNEKVCSNPVIIKTKYGLHVIPITVYTDSQRQAVLDFAHDVLSHSNKAHCPITIEYKDHMGLEWFHDK